MAEKKPHRLLSFTSERQIVKFDQAEKDFFLLTTIEAPELDEEEGEDERKPIDLALVIDRSGSMSGEKIDLVRKTLKFLVAEMQEKDRMGIVLFDSDVEILCPLTLCTGANKEDILRKIDTIQDRGSTYLSGGLYAGLELLRKRAPDSRNDIASVLLLTDGHANSGLQSTPEIVEMVRGKRTHPAISVGSSGGSILKRHLRKKRAKKKKMKSKRRVAPPAAESDIVKPAVGAYNYVAEGFNIFTFGFGKSHNENMLKEIAQAANGVYYFIENSESVADAFVDCLGGLLSVVCKDLKVTLKPEGGVVINTCHTVYKQEKLLDGSVVVRLPDLQSEEKRDIMLQVSIPAVQAEDMDYRVLSLSIDYKDKDDAVKHEDLIGCIPRMGTEPASQEVNEVIDEQRNRIIAAEVAVEAKRLADADQYEAARKRVAEAIGKIEKSASRAKAFSQALVGDLREQHSNLNRPAYHAGGYRKKISAVQQEWCYQRSAAPQSRSNVIMKSKKKRAMRKRKKAYFGDSQL